MAHPWEPRSTTVVVLSDGDTVPATGMPAMPISVSNVLVVGVGDERTGSFIDGRNSRQDASTLRQIAVRLGGKYHNGNQRHVRTSLLQEIDAEGEEGRFERLTEREYALLATGLGAAILAALPVLLHLFGTSWRPGVPRSAARIAPSRTGARGSRQSAPTPAPGRL